MKLREQGLSRDEVMAELAALREHDADWRSGRVFGYNYDGGRDVERVTKEAYTAFVSENGLDPTAYPSLHRLEIDVVSMAIAHLHGGDDVVGTFTSGGTESIILAVKAARDAHRSQHPEITTPEMIVPETAHAAFHKAGHYLGVKVVTLSVDAETFIAETEKIGELINERTCLLVASAPGFAHGVIDPIEAMGSIAASHDLWFHVDACIGGFLLPYFARLGADVPKFDFRVPGVSSISMDLHKYAYCAKGASTLLMRHRDLRRHQIYSCSAWSGYSVVNMTVQSSKSGGPLAAAWATLNYLGDEGYLRLARDTKEATERLRDGIDAIEELHILGTPQMSLLAFRSDDVNVFHIDDEMKLRGWTLGAQLEFENSPANIHLTVCPNHLPQVGRFLTDLKEAVAAAKKLPTSPIASTLKQTFAAMDPKDVSDEALAGLFTSVGVEGGTLPSRRAEINEILNALPAPLSERLLREFFNQLF